jgi:NADPH:quinone reductase
MIVPKHGQVNEKETRGTAMQAAWYTQNGPAREVIRIGEQPEPLPAADEVRVRIAYSGVNPSDVKRREGWRGQKLGFPLAVPNNDGSGVIDAVGNEVDPGRIGERVWLHSTGWKRPLGSAAQFAATPAHRAIRLPDGVPMATGAGLGVPAMTAHRSVFGCGPVDGKTVLVTGGAGAVGFYAVQLAAWGGARVIATVSSAQKAALAEQAGAHACIDYRKEPVGERILELTGGEGVDHVVEVDFGANLAVTLGVLKANGSVATYASMAEPEPRLPFYALMTKNVRMLWVFVYEMPRDAMDEAARDICAWLESGRARHPPAHIFPLASLAQAHEAVEAGIVGKVLVEVGGEQP